MECRYRFYRRYFNPSGLYLTRVLRAMDDCSSLYNHYSTPERSQVKRRRPRRVQNQPKATTSHTFRDGDVSEQDIFRLLLASCRKRSNCIEKLRPYSSDIGCHAKRFSRRDRDPVRRFELPLLRVMDAVTGRFGLGRFHCGPTVGQHRVSNFRLATASGPTGMAGLGLGA